MTTTPLPKPEIGDILTSTWEVFAKNIGLVLLFTSVSVAPTLLTSIAINQIFDLDTATLNDDVAAITLVVLGVGFLLSLIFGFIVNIMSIVTFLDVIKTGNSYSFGEAFEMSKPYFGRLFLVSLVVGLIILGGLILLIIPGILFGLWYMFASYIAVDSKEMSIGQVLKRSKQLFKTKPGLPVVWILLGVALSIGLSLIMLPITVVLSAISPVISDLFSSFITAGLTYFYVIGFAYVYNVLKVLADTGEVPASLPGAAPAKK